MYKSKVLVGLVLLLYLLFVIFEFSENYAIAHNFDTLILPLITVIYILYASRKNVFFLLFLLCYSISDLMGLFGDYIPYEIDYYLGNSLYIMAYFFLFIKITRYMSIMHVLRNFKIHLIVLLALNIYLVYVLQVIVSPYVDMQSAEFYIELAYNTMMLLVLSGALLNYFYRDGKKALLLFVGSLCIVFSEVIEVAYIYIAQKSLLGFLSTTLALAAFYFFYQQSRLVHEQKETSYSHHSISDTTNLF